MLWSLALVWHSTKCYNISILHMTKDNGMQQTVPDLIHFTEIIVICMQFNSIHRLMNVQHECFRNSNTLNWNAICICNMQCSHRKFKWSLNHSSLTHSKHVCNERIFGFWFDSTAFLFHMQMICVWFSSQRQCEWVGKAVRLQLQSNALKIYCRNLNE